MRARARAVNQKVRIHSIAFKGPTDGSGPKVVKLFTNRVSFGFGDADAMPCAEQLALTDAQLAEGATIPLKLTKVVGVGTVLQQAGRRAGRQAACARVRASGVRGGEMPPARADACRVPRASLPRARRLLLCPAAVQQRDHPVHPGGEQPGG